MKNTKNIVWMSILIIGLIVGLIGMINQISTGHVVTGISQQVPWGVYIAAFTFFMGISIGVTFIGFLIHSFNVESLKPFEFKAVIVSLSALVGALLFLLMDVGNPIKMLGVPLLLRNTTSVFFYSSLSYYAFGILLLMQLMALIKIQKGTANEKIIKRLKWLSIISLPFALGIVLVPDGALFSFVKAREFWNRPLLLPHFANAALASGVAVIVAITAINHYIKNERIVKESTLKFFRFALLFLVAGVLFLDVFDILVLKYSEKLAGIEAWNLLTGKHLFFFVLNLGGLFIALLVLINKIGAKLSGLFISSILVIFAISAYRYNLIIVGQEVPLMNGLSAGEYSVTITEVAVASGITSCCLIVYQLLSMKFNKKSIV
ncbi:MAG: polysulfide reductase NrfD [Bacteroidetes bacterium]|jgi:dimethyl sulfoxide reductase membrane subunit|nr:polysulfide reductase NrfD [Bacteroidota bacterium]MBT6685593.1 polysulfide reductase NrfD [Bacteroidota bacterium]MBT7142682.1 polysulfide reductase NrfD [Bacteroidota bacterium]MBT7490920.1 polysulfide reductase NrfD [Bacteroidota bacterium]